MNNIQELREKLQAERSLLVDDLAPLLDARQKLAAKIAKQELELRELDKQLREKRGTRLYDLDMQIAALTKISPNYKPLPTVEDSNANS